MVIKKHLMPFNYQMCFYRALSTKSRLKAKMDWGGKSTWHLLQTGISRIQIHPKCAQEKEGCRIHHLWDNRKKYEQANEIKQHRSTFFYQNAENTW